MGHCAWAAPPWAVTPYWAATALGSCHVGLGRSWVLDGRRGLEGGPVCTSPLEREPQVSRDVLLDLGLLLNGQSRWIRRLRRQAASSSTLRQWLRAQWPGCSPRECTPPRATRRSPRRRRGRAGALPKGHLDRAGPRPSPCRSSRSSARPRDGARRAAAPAGRGTRTAPRAQPRPCCAA
eukprot:scaffold45848_cov40-Phaeocystis_antarctica.AAC.3